MPGLPARPAGERVVDGGDEGTAVDAAQHEVPRGVADLVQHEEALRLVGSGHPVGGQVDRPAASLRGLGARAPAGRAAQQRIGVDGDRPSRRSSTGRAREISGRGVGRHVRAGCGRQPGERPRPLAAEQPMPMTGGGLTGRGGEQREDSRGARWRRAASCSPRSVRPLNTRSTAAQRAAAVRCSLLGAVLEFRVLGPFEVWRDGVRVELGGARRRAFLALLS